jgi:hypothetical protein
VKLTGDPEAIAALKSMHQKNEGFMKALLDDARSTTDHQTTFRDERGLRWRLKLDPVSGALNVERHPDSQKPPAVT